MRIRRFVESDSETVVELWRTSDLIRPGNDPNREIERKLADSPWCFLVMVDADEVIGSIMVGYDGHRGWVNYLACRHDHRRRGVATALMARADEILSARGCPKINLQVRTGNTAALGFYESLGYVEDEVSSFGRRLVIDGRTDSPSGSDR